MGNPNHDTKGRFASSGGSGGGASQTPDSKRADKAAAGGHQHEVARKPGKAERTGRTSEDYRKLAQHHSMMHAETIARTTGPNSDAIFKLAKSHEHKAARAMQASRAAANRALEAKIASRAHETYSQREERYRREWDEAKKKAGGVSGYAALRPGDTPWSRFEGVRY